MSYSMKCLFHKQPISLTPVEKYMVQVIQEIRLNNLRVPSSLKLRESVCKIRLTDWT